MTWITLKEHPATSLGREERKHVKKNVLAPDSYAGGKI